MNIRCTPESNLRWMRDPVGNTLAVAYFGGKGSELEIDTRIDIELQEDNPFDFIIDTHAMQYPFSYKTEELEALAPYLSNYAGADEVFGWISRSVPRKNQTLELLLALNQAVHESVDYERRDDEGVQTPDETLARAMGSCRDSAMLFIAACRILDIAARFVSGYLYDPPEEGGEHIFNRAVGSMHAWAEAYIPGAGWKGFDPTNGILANHYFIPTAVAHRPELVNPIQGNYYSDQSTPSQMDVTLSIEPIT